MNKTCKRVLSALLILGVLTLPCGLSLDRDALAESITQTEDAAAPALTSAHIAYIAGYPDGTMRPDKTVTRAEAVTFLYRLLQHPESGTAPCDYSDVSDDDWFAEPVRAVCRLGLLANTTHFRPNAAITRAEFVAILVKLCDDVPLSAQFNDVPADHWAADAIAKAAALGWVLGYKDGSFQPDQTLSRAEACAIFNRVTARRGNTAQSEALLNLGLYEDVTADHWASTDIVEASIAHTPGQTLLSEHWVTIDTDDYRFTPGVHEVNDVRYAVDRNGLLLTDQIVGAYTAGANGTLYQTARSYALSAPYISQLDGLNAEMACEPISALMGLRAKGFAEDITPEEFLDGLPYAASNPADGFVGSPYYSDGSYSSIDPQPLADYCNTLCGAPLCADISGASLEEVQRELLAGNCIVAYQTFWWKPVSYTNFIIDGTLTPMVANNHVRLICGYDPARGYLVSDPYNYYNPGHAEQYWIAVGFFDYCWNQRQVGMVIR